MKKTVAHQFALKQQHGTLEYFHRVFLLDFKGKMYYAALFLDLSYVKIWLMDLIYKARKILHVSYFLIRKSYLKISVRQYAATYHMHQQSS